MLQRAHIVSVHRETPRSLLLDVRLSEPLPFRAGQAVLIGSGDSSPLRPYSIAAGPAVCERTATLQLLVGVGDDGTPGPHLPVVTPGTRVAVEGPFGTFVYPGHVDERAVLFVAGGSGIAPLRAMLQDVLESRQPPVASLLYSARTPDEFAFDAELTALAREGRLRYQRTATREADPAWHGERGRISRAHLEVMVESPETLCFVCGPAALVHEVPRMLLDIGVAPERIRVEEWAIPKAPPR